MKRTPFFDREEEEIITEYDAGTSSQSRTRKRLRAKPWKPPGGISARMHGSTFGFRLPISIC